MKQISLQSLKRPALVSIVIVIILAIVFGLSHYLSSQKSHAGKTESITIGMTVQELNALIYIADDQNFFAANGLNVTTKNYDTGRAAVDGMLNNEVDMATSAELVIVGKAFAGAQVRTIGTIAKSQNSYLIGRTDKGIHNISDLRGKKIGLTRGTITDFHLDRFLDLHGMSMQQVIPVDIKASQYVDTIANGDVDAVLVWQPYAYEIQKRMGNGTIIWPAQSEQPFYWNAISTDGWITNHPDMVYRFLKSLTQAEEYTIYHPAEAKAIVQKRVNVDADYMDTVWRQNQFTLSLDGSLILAMEDEARWMIKNNLTSEKKTPNFLDYIYLDGLEKIKPESVNIIH